MHYLPEFIECLFELLLIESECAGLVSLDEDALEGTDGHTLSLLQEKFDLGLDPLNFNLQTHTVQGHFYSKY